MASPRPHERHAILETRRTLKMARSTHAYVRGNTAKFYEWLAEAPATRRIPQGPAIWICGDCHLGNLGPINDGDGRIAIQVRDLDQAVIGNPAHDLIHIGPLLRPGCGRRRLCCRPSAGADDGLGQQLR